MANTPTIPELGTLSVDVYLKPEERGQADNGWSRYKDAGDRDDSGLKAANLPAQ